MSYVRSGNLFFIHNIHLRKLVKFSAGIRYILSTSSYVPLLRSVSFLKQFPSFSLHVSCRDTLLDGLQQVRMSVPLHLQLKLLHDFRITYVTLRRITRQKVFSMTPDNIYHLKYCNEVSYVLPKLVTHVRSVHPSFPCWAVWTSFKGSLPLLL